MRPTAARPILRAPALIAVLSVFIFLPASALASNGTHIPTTTYTQNTIWTTAGSPYILDGNVTVASGVTLTINPGVVVKLNGTLRELVVNGTLTAVGAQGNEIVFTSYKDDTAGGDSNGDGGATSPVAGDWYRLRVAAGTASELRYAKVRYGGWGSANNSYGAVTADGSSTQLTVANAEITLNQRSGIYVQTGGGVIVSASTISQNGNGISANMGWVKVKARTLLTNNAADGLYFSYTSTYTGTTSSIFDSDVANNPGRGIYISAYGLAAGKYPYGSRNNIYANGGGSTAGKQLVTTQRRWDVDWTGNYWGSDVYFWKAAGICQGVTDESYGHLSYRWSNPPPSGGLPTPPDGPIAHGNYVAVQGNEVANCPRDNYRNFALDYSPYYLGGTQPPLANGQALVCASVQDFLNKIGKGYLTACKSDPVNSATGNLSHRVTDVALPGIGTTFSFTRTYNSLDTTSGPLGIGWAHNHLASLTIKASGDISLRNGDGQRFEYAKQSDGSFTPPAGGLASLASVAGGYELTTLDRSKLRFDTNGRPTSLKDRNGQGLTYAYDGQARLSTITDAVDRVVTLSYDGSGRLTQVSLPDGRSVSYAYTSGRLTSVTDATNKVWTYAYESHGLLEKETDPLGHVVFRNVYGPDGRVAEQYDALSNRTTLAWDYQTQTQTLTDARNNIWRDVYQANVLKKRIDPFGNETVYGYDGSLNRSSVTDPLGKTWTMSYDARGNMLTRTAPAPLSYVESWTYSANNDLLSATDGRGNTTTYSYDGNGNLTQITQPGSVVTQLAYDPGGTGLVTSVTDPRGKVSTLAYDAQGNLNRITTPLGKIATAVYDAGGRPTSFVEPRGNVQGADPNLYKWTFSYDPANRPLTEADSLGNLTTLAYDSDGRLTSVTDAKSQVTSYAYDAADRLTTVTAPGGAATTYVYDAVGNPTSRTDAQSHTTSFVYDAGNRLTSVTSPGSKTWQYAYNASNRLTLATLPSGQTLGSGYDAIGRLTSVDYSDSTPDISFVYDANGNRTQMTDGQGTATSAFDALNRLTSTTRGSDSFAYAYDAGSNVTQRTLPDGRVMTYTYDDDGLLSSLTTGGLTTSYLYDAAGNATQTTLPSGNGYVEERTYDRAGRLTRIKSAKGASVLADFSYTLDAVGNPSQIVRAGNLPGTETYTYDVRDRLTEVCFQASCPGGSDPFIRWTYDGAGNRLTEARPSGTTSYAYNSDDQLTQAGSTSYSYDTNGNQTQAGSRSFSWNLAGRMTQTTLGATTTSYAYDGLGNRLQQTTGSQVTTSLWDVSQGPPPLALERDGSGQTLRSYTHGLGLVSMLSGGQQHYVHGDALGSTANVTSASGGTEWTYGYEPYGSARTTTQNDPSAPANPIRFAGEYADDTGLYNLRARLYDPSNGRFASQRPLPSDLGQPAMSSYAYADNRPSARVSPSGIVSSSPPATEGCGPGITRCSLEKYANEACPPPLTPYMGLPGFKDYWLDGYYSACNGLKAMLRGQLGVDKPGACENDRNVAKWAISAAFLAVGVSTIGLGARIIWVASSGGLETGLTGWAAVAARTDLIKQGAWGAVNIGGGAALATVGGGCASR